MRVTRANFFLGIPVTFLGLPGNLCLPGWYVNQMGSCTPTGEESMFRTSLQCDQEYCTNYTTNRPRDIMVLLDYWQQ
jgi:hypothetical protein